MWFKSGLRVNIFIVYGMVPTELILVSVEPFGANVPAISFHYWHGTSTNNLFSQKPTVSEDFLPNTRIYTLVLYFPAIPVLTLPFKFGLPHHGGPE